MEKQKVLDYHTVSRECKLSGKKKKGRGVIIQTKIQTYRVEINIGTYWVYIEIGLYDVCETVHHVLLVCSKYNEYHSLLFSPFKNKPVRIENRSEGQTGLQGAIYICT